MGRLKKIYILFLFLLFFVFLLGLHTACNKWYFSQSQKACHGAQARWHDSKAKSIVNDNVTCWPSSIAFFKLNRYATFYNKITFFWCLILFNIFQFVKFVMSKNSHMF